MSIAEMQKRKRPILCYSEFRAKIYISISIDRSKANEVVKGLIL